MTTNVDLDAEYAALKAQAEVLAGSLNDVQRRVSILTHIYLDSRRNHAFSAIAAHGALWAMAYFEGGGSLGRLIARRYFYNSRERAYRLGILREFAESFRAVNRQVCVNTFTNYQFVRRFGGATGAEKIVPSNLLAALNQVHEARAAGVELDAQQKRDIFQHSFRCEQEITVAPGVARAVAEFNCRIMRNLCLRPMVRFSYFPKCRYLFFRDFSSTEERITKGLRAYDLAVQAGWDRVYESMLYYGQMPNEFFADPNRHYHGIRQEVIAAGQVAQSLAKDD